MLIGEFQHNIDKKGRVFIPAKLREDLGERFIVSKALDGTPCLFLYPQTEWQRLVDKLSEQSFVKSRKLQRFLFSGAAELEYDSQGRACIPQNLREYAALGDGTEAAIIGASTRIEIWNSNNWKAESEDITSDAIIDILEELDF
ncbi:MAG: division/cell wall cluster transcriptional repressor MraZ [Clostridiales bacterium 43-6]|nr:MAG: division/cell wall cluster transcriptional repressor MraZ [Clostridiales bacterium 43-6]